MNLAAVSVPPAERARTRPFVVALLVVVGLAGLVLRLLPQWVPVGDLNSDEAIVGLMAKHLFDGGAKVFYWGQTYGGTPEVVVSAAFRELFGHSLFALRLPSLLYGIVAAVLLWHVAKALLPRRQAIVAVAAFWLGPMLFLDYASREMLFYTPTLVVGLLLLLLAIRYVDRPGRHWLAAWFGLLAGVGFWMGGNIAYFAVPAAVYVVWSLRRIPRSALVAIPLFFVGSAPWWIWNLTHDWGSITYARSVWGPGVVDNLGQYLHDGLRVLFGFWPLTDLGGWRGLTIIAFWVLLAALVVAAALALRRAFQGGPVPLDVVGFVTAPFIYAVLPLRLPFVVLRLFLFVWPFASLLLGRLAARRWTAAVLACGLAALLAVNLHDYLVMPQGVPDLAEAGHVLEAAGRTTFFGDYWTTYKLSFESDERVVGSPFYTARWPAYDEAARADPASSYVFRKGAPDLQLVLAAAQARGLHAEVLPAAGYVVVLLDGRLAPEDVATRALSGF